MNVALIVPCLLESYSRPSYIIYIEIHVRDQAMELGTAFSGESVFSWNNASPPPSTNLRKLIPPFIKTLSNSSHSLILL